MLKMTTPYKVATPTSQCLVKHIGASLSALRLVVLLPDYFSVFAWRYGQLSPAPHKNGNETMQLSGVQ